MPSMKGRHAPNVFLTKRFCYLNVPLFLSERGVAVAHGFSKPLVGVRFLPFVLWVLLRIIYV